MKILVIGGTGNVGAEVVKELQNRNADIRLLVRKEGDEPPKGVEGMRLSKHRIDGRTWAILLITDAERPRRLG